MAIAYIKTAAELRSEHPEEQLTTALAGAGFNAEQIDKIVKILTAHCPTCYQHVGEGMCYCDYDSRPDF